MTELNINRQEEIISVPDGEGGTACEWTVATDDASIERMIAEIGDAAERAHRLVRLVERADSIEAADEAKGSLVRLQRRVIEAVIGDDGYRDVLSYIGGGRPCDPSMNVTNIGEVMAALLMWVYARCTSRTLAAAQSIASQLPRKKRPKKKGRK